MRLGLGVYRVLGGVTLVLFVLLLVLYSTVYGVVTASFIVGGVLWIMVVVGMLFIDKVVNYRILLYILKGFGVILILNGLGLVFLGAIGGGSILFAPLLMGLGTLYVVDGILVVVASKNSIGV